MTTRAWLVVVLAAALVGCGDDDRADRVATPTPSVARTPCRPEPTGCRSNSACRAHADCVDPDGICVASAADEGLCFCRFTGRCRYREAVGRCDGFCGGGISACISASDLSPGFDPRACLCEPPSPTPDPSSTPLPDGECNEAAGVAAEQADR